MAESTTEEIHKLLVEQIKEYNNRPRQTLGLRQGVILKKIRAFARLNLIYSRLVEHREELDKVKALMGGRLEKDTILSNLKVVLKDINSQESESPSDQQETITTIESNRSDKAES